MLANMLMGVYWILFAGLLMIAVILGARHRLSFFSGDRLSKKWRIVGFTASIIVIIMILLPMFFDFGIRL